MLKSIHLLTQTNVWQRAAGSRSLRAAFFTFVLTRSIVLIILVSTGHINKVTSWSADTGTRHTHFSLRSVNAAAVLRETVILGDVAWYMSIAEQGYEIQSFNTDAHHNWAFFPLFPLLLRGASFISGEFLFTGMLLSHLFFLAALILTYKTAREFGLNEATADRTIFYLAVFPTSFFFSLPMTESLFLCLTVGSFYAAKRQRWWVACILCALASATRVTGILLLPSLILLYSSTYGKRWWRRDLLWLLITPTGLLSFMGYLYYITGNPLAFKDIQVVWGRGTGFFLIPLFNYLAHPLILADAWDLRLINFFAAITTLTCGILLLKRREFALALYTLLSVIVTLSSLQLQSQGRYALVVFPVFMILAIAGQHQRVDQTIRAVSLVLLALMTVTFALHFSFAIS
jgi:Gpi18-like mannosyltransferase